MYEIIYYIPDRNNIFFKGIEEKIFDSLEMLSTYINKYKYHVIHIEDIKTGGFTALRYHIQKH